MSLKRVSFKVAKAIREAGYPQGDKNSGITYVYPLENHDDNYTPYTRIGKLTTNYHCQTFRILSEIPFVVAPTYIEVWFWLWREKGMVLTIERMLNKWDCRYEVDDERLITFAGFTDPEATIIEAIEYLVDNNEII